MSVTLVILLLVLLIAIGVLIRMRNKSTEVTASPEPAARAVGSAYHAVSIKTSGSACKAARDMAGRRFLSSAAPKLPLPACDMLQCNCRFVHHKDRRTGKDRRSPFGPSGFGGATGSYQAEQRQGGDRRKDQD